MLVYALLSPSCLEGQALQLLVPFRTSLFPSFSLSPLIAPAGDGLTSKRLFCRKMPFCIEAWDPTPQINESMCASAKRKRACAHVWYDSLQITVHALYTLLLLLFVFASFCPPFFLLFAVLLACPWLCPPPV